MRAKTDLYSLHLPDLPLRSVEQMGLKELERIRLILRGGSVIEWRRLHFLSRDEVDRFLRLSCFDPSSPHDEAWIRTVLRDAVEYLRKAFDYRVAEAVAQPEEVHDLILYASGLKEPTRYRKIACVVLKVMHVIQHIEGRDLLFNLPISEAELAELVIQKVNRVAEEMVEKGLPVLEFKNSVKSRGSLVTKLLAKKETVAAQVYDKTRFRVVTPTQEDLLPVLYFLTQRLFPFNLVVPGQTENTLLPFRQLLETYPHFQKHVPNLHLAQDYENRKARRGNSFSGKSYRNLNFVVDVPIRLDPYLPLPELDLRERKNRVGYALVEFQIMDERTARENENGDNSHDRYKQRQKQRVLRRLSRGLVVPKAPPKKPRVKKGKKGG